MVLDYPFCGSIAKIVVVVNTDFHTARRINIHARTEAYKAVVLAMYQHISLLDAAQYTPRISPATCTEAMSVPSGDNTAPARNGQPSGAMNG